jgi:hypothetical protein
MSGHAEKQLHDLALLELYFLLSMSTHALKETNLLASLTWPYEKLRNGVACNLNNAADFWQKHQMQKDRGEKIVCLYIPSILVMYSAVLGRPELGASAFASRLRNCCCRNDKVS